MKNKIFVFATLLLFSINSFSQTAGTNCSDAEPACSLPTGFQATSTGNTAPELVGNNISNPSTNPNGSPGNSGCSFSNGVSPNWISISVTSNGVLEFSIGQNGGNGYFDWVMWDNTNGSACTDITNNTLPPVACNWNAASAGFTGMTTAGNLPMGANQGNFENAINVSSGDQFILLFSNYSGLSPLNVELDFDPNSNPNAANVSCTPIAIPDQTICEGDVASVHVPQLNSAGLPLNIISYSWSPSTNIDLPNGGPDVSLSPTDTTKYYVTLTSNDSTWLDSVNINVVHLLHPDAGLDDSLCFINGQGYPLLGVQDDPTNSINWEFFIGPPDAAGTPNAIFQPNSTILAATTLTNYPGDFVYVLHEIDQYGICPDGTDTVTIFFSKETHTTTFTDPTCFEGTDGSISITSTGVVGGTQYSFNNGAYYSSNSDSLNLEAGVYDVISQNYLGCTASSQITITDPLEIMITVGPLPDSTVCENGSAVLYASAINGTTYDFHWNHTSNLNFEQTIYPINDTIVTVFAESELGCLSEILPISILLHDPIALSITANDTICPGYDSQIIVEALGGFQGYNYVWEVNNTSYNSSANIIDVNPNVESNYCVTVTDGCETTPKTICTRVVMREVPVPLFSTDLVEGCNPTEINFTNETVFNLAETQIDSINWLIDGVLFNTPTVTHLFENVGEYDIELEIFTQYNCHNSMTASEYISIHEIPVATFYVISNPTTIFNTEVDMINNTQGDNLTFQWSNTGAVPASSNAEAPTVVYPEGVAADYPVQLVVTNEFGCTDTTTDIVHVISDVLIYAPNTFTPDGDQINNTWRVYIDGIDFTDYHLLIFNRWGEIVWESYDAEAEWDGTYGSSNIVKDGTYVWSLITKDANTDKKYQFRGTVNIIK